MIYLDNCATTKPCKESIDAINFALTNNWGNPSSLHKLGIEAEKMLDNARVAIAKEIGCEDKEIIFTSGGTEANNLAIFGAVYANKRKGNRIVTTEVEHHSVLECFEKLESEGFELIKIKPDNFGNISKKAIIDAINADTIFVSIMLINNEVGAINSITEAKKAILAANSPAILHTDAVQAFGKMKFKVKDLGADIITISAHKIGGPKGVGALYKASNCRILPHTIGGGQEKNIRSGTEATPLIAGFGAAVNAIDHSTIEHIQNLNAYLRDKLSDVEGIIVNSDYNSSPYILNISVLGYRSETLLHFLEARDIYVSSGSACAKGKGSHVLGAMGLDRKRIDSALRISFSKDNTKEDIDTFCDALKLAKKILRSSGR